MYMYMYIYTHVSMCICIYAHIYIYIYLHVYTPSINFAYDTHYKTCHVQYILYAISSIYNHIDV